MYEAKAADVEALAPFDLTGRVIVVTGGAGLLGSRYARALTTAGARVVVADLDADAADQVASALEPGRALAVAADVTDAEAVRRMKCQTLEAFGRIDGLVNNAAIDPKFDVERAAEHRSDFESYPLEAWNASLAVGLTGAFLCAQSLAPAILEGGGGSIVNISSIYGMVGPDQRLYENGAGSPRRYKPIAYSVVKSAIHGLTRYLATYYAGRPLRVNTLALGGVEAGHDPGFVERYAARAPLGRMARPDEYNGALAFLLSDASSYMTGASLVVDGGWTAW